MDLKKENYKNYTIYFYDNYFLELGKNIVDKNINIVKEIKVTDRNYVAKIKYKKRNYILKSPKNEQIKFQKKIITLFTKGEALTTLINTNRLIKNGINIFAIPYVAIVKRNKGFIEESFFITENLEEKENYSHSKEKIEEIYELSKILHKNKIYHGDLNLANVIFTVNRPKFIDTKCKKYYIGEYKSNYDKITLEYNTYGTLGKQPWYKKNIWYYLALKIKTIKTGGEKDWLRN